jgi:hypothetical protein
MGLKSGDLIARGVATTTWAPSLQNFDHKMENKVLKIGSEALPPTRIEIHHASIVQRPQRQSNLRRRRQEAGWDPISWVPDLGVTFRLTVATQFWANTNYTLAHTQSRIYGYRLWSKG